MKLTKFLISLCASSVILSLVACGGGGQGHNRPKASNDEVMAAYASLLQAFEKKDVNALDHMFSAHSTVVAPPLAGRVMTWSDARPMVEESLKASGELQISRSDNG